MTITFKAENYAESDAILVSFDARWDSLLREGKVRAVIRRRVPKSNSPAWLYFYVKSPVAKVIGRAGITRIQSLSPRAIMAQAEPLQLSRAEISDYCAGYSSVGFVALGPVELGDLRAGLEELRAAGDFFPPQSFTYLSLEGQCFLDRALGIAGSRGQSAQRSRKTRQRKS